MSGRKSPDEIEADELRERLARLEGRVARLEADQSEPARPSLEERFQAARERIYASTDRRGVQGAPIRSSMR